MQKELRDAWVADLRTNAPPNMKSVGESGRKFGMFPECPCALARCLIVGGVTPNSDNATYDLFDDPTSKFYLGVRPAAIYAKSDMGMASSEIADWIEANIPVTQ